jgi:hypothetical protein
MRLLLIVESEINQAEGLSKLEVGCVFILQCQKNNSEGNSFFVWVLQKKKQKLQDILDENAGVTLHPNHFLLTGIREKIIQIIMAQKDSSGGGDPKEALKLLTAQVDLFGQVAEVMSKVDLPKDFWMQTLDKMQTELVDFHQKQT